jgi:transcriptional regulator with XRE-family HTH domain
MNRMRRARQLADKTQVQLMKETQINYATISRIENGWLIPTEEQKQKLAMALSADVDWLFPEKKMAR